METAADKRLKATSDQMLERMRRDGVPEFVATYYRKQREAYDVLDKSDWGGRIPNHRNSTLRLPL